MLDTRTARSGSDKWTPGPSPAAAAGAATTFPLLSYQRRQSPSAPPPRFLPDAPGGSDARNGVKIKLDRRVFT